MAKAKAEAGRDEGMCGIAGFVNGGGVAADRDVLARMTATLAHRGPDGDGFYVDGPVGLGHRRLSIIDLAGGAQPMANEDGSVWVTYNGELYNEPACATGCSGAGHVYRTVVRHREPRPPLRGARARVRRRAQRHVRAGDLGPPPTAGSSWPATGWARSRSIYAETPGGGLVFGSEPKALLAASRASPGGSIREGLARYLFYEYVPAPHSIWEGIKKLPPAHVLVWEDGKTTL